MLQRATAVSIQILAMLLLATVAIPYVGANEYSRVRVHQKADSNIVVYITRAGKPVPHQKIFVERTLRGQDFVPVEEFIRTADSAGVVYLNDLRPGDFYVIRVLNEEEDTEKEEYSIPLDLEIVPGSASTFELKSVENYLPAEIKTTAALGAFRGVVVDPSGAVIPNVNIEITQTDHDPPIIRSLQSNSTGNFSSELPNGAYTIKFKSRGFRTLLWQVTVTNHETNAWKGARVCMRVGSSSSSAREAKTEELK